MKWKKKKSSKSTDIGSVALDSRQPVMIWKSRLVGLLDGDQELIPISSDVRRVMLDFEINTAEGLNVVRLRETFT